MNRVSKNIFTYFLLLFFLTSCYASSSLTTLTPSKSSPSTTPLRQSSLMDIISGSNTKSVVTGRGYTSYGAVGSRIQEATAQTSRGYKVYSSVDGEIISKLVEAQ